MKKKNKKDRRMITRRMRRTNIIWNSLQKANVLLSIACLCAATAIVALNLGSACQQVPPRIFLIHSCAHYKDCGG